MIPAPPRWLVGLVLVAWAVVAYARQWAERRQARRGVGWHWTCSACGSYCEDGPCVGASCRRAWPHAECPCGKTPTFGQLIDGGFPTDRRIVLTTHPTLRTVP